MTVVGRFALMLVLIPGTIAPHDAAAQGVFRVTPLFNISHLHDTNVFATSVNPEADFITRVSPGLETEYRSPRIELRGRYALDAERFADHAGLSSVNAQRTALSLRYQLARGLELASGAELSRTQTPADLNLDTGLILGRAAAQRITAHAAIARRLARDVSGRIDYRYTDDRLTGAFGNRTHSAGVGAEHRVSSGDTLTVVYRVHQFAFAARDAATVATSSHALSLGWTRTLTRQTSLSMLAGPRLDDGSLAAEFSASVSHRIRPVDVSLAYARKQTTVIGLPGAADTQSVNASAGWTLSRRRLQLRASPGVFQTSHPLLNEIVYRMSMGIARPITSSLSIDAALDLYVQPASHDLTLSRERLARQTVSIRLIAGPAARH